MPEVEKNPFRDAHGWPGELVQIWAGNRLAADALNDVFYYLGGVPITPLPQAALAFAGATHKDFLRIFERLQQLEHQLQQTPGLFEDAAVWLEELRATKAKAALLAKSKGQTFYEAEAQAWLQGEGPGGGREIRKAFLDRV